MVSRRRGRGFTLLEVLISICLMFLGLLGLVSLQVVASRANSQARAIGEATALAQDKLEALRRTPLASLAGSTEPQIDATGAPIPQGAYTRTTTVALAGGSANLRVQVSWNGADGRAHGVTVATVRSP